ncbi:Thrombospondin type 1 domain [Popillia japonica]|uniref:Thrombospondin type 1 domain n=1 Tax=Popillia japonica TaxID=7064 RepID=A0AAW1KGI0_POPJA
MKLDTQEVAVALFVVKLCWSESSPNSIVKRKYPARVYEMYKERQKSKSQKEPGVWSPWSEWSPCSRSCGGGVTQQTRQCVSAQTMKESQHAYEVDECIVRKLCKCKLSFFSFIDDFSEYYA